MLIFIAFTMVKKDAYCIQIHLMLIFIRQSTQTAPVLLVIQIHLMLIFIHSWTSTWMQWTSIQIHLMLIFIQPIPLENVSHAIIQIHLMLIFIFKVTLISSIGCRHSNTSHVNLYLEAILFHILHKIHSNTSHVNLYLIALYSPAVTVSIQIHLMLIFIVLCTAWKKKVHLYSNTSHVNLYLSLKQFSGKTYMYSNTSHVNLYQNVLSSVRYPTTFKYISC